MAEPTVFVGCLPFHTDTDQTTNQPTRIPVQCAVVAVYHGLPHLAEPVLVWRLWKCVPLYNTGYYYYYVTGCRGLWTPLQKFLGCTWCGEVREVEESLA